MPQKNAKKQRQIEAEAATEAQVAEYQAIIADLETQIEVAKEQLEIKQKNSQEDLVRNLKQAAEKYLTVNGFLQARDTLESVRYGENIDDIDMVAKGLAKFMCDKANELAKVAESIKPEEINDDFLDNVIDVNFVLNSTKTTPVDVVRELLLCTLCQNVQGIIDDVVEFRAGHTEGLEKANEFLIKAKDMDAGTQEGYQQFMDMLEEIGAVQQPSMAPMGPM